MKILSKMLEAHNISQRSRIIKDAVIRLKNLEETAHEECNNKELPKRLPRHVKLMIDSLRDGMEKDAKSGSKFPSLTATVEQIDGYLSKSDNLQSFEQYRTLIDAYLNAPTTEDVFFERADAIIKSELDDKYRESGYKFTQKPPKEQRAREEFIRKQIKRNKDLKRTMEPLLPKKSAWDPKKRLDQASIDKIKALYYEIGGAERSKVKLAKEFKVSVSAISRILKSKKRNSTLADMVEEMGDKDQLHFT